MTWEEISKSVLLYQKGEAGVGRRQKGQKWRWRRGRATNEFKQGSYWWFKRPWDPSQVGRKRELRPRSENNPGNGLKCALSLFHLSKMAVCYQWSQSLVDEVRPGNGERTTHFLLLSLVSFHQKLRDFCPPVLKCRCLKVAPDSLVRYQSHSEPCGNSSELSFPKLSILFKTCLKESTENCKLWI